MGKNSICSWDDGKRQTVFVNREIDFAELKLFFKDSNALTKQDKRHEYGEMRYNMIASHKEVVLNITFTPRNGLFHIISARIANRKERKLYGESKQSS
jgi:uncharacterized protein